MCHPDINTLLSCNHLFLAVVRTMCCRIICCGVLCGFVGARSAICTDSSPAFLTHICGNVLQMLHSAAPSLPFAREVEFACQLPERSCLRVNRGSWCLFKVLVAVQAGNAEEQIFVNGVLSYLTFSKDKTLSRGFSSSNLVWPCKE